jgi:DNA-binding CsgD family transcriptional regulator
MTMPKVLGVRGQGTNDESPDPRPLTHDPCVLDLRGSLVDKSLVRYEPDAPVGPRYDLLETVREFAAEEFAVHGDAEVARRAHAECFLALAEAARPELAGPSERTWVDRLEAEHGNIRVALGWLEHAGRWVDCLRLAGAVSRFWDLHGHLSEGRAWLERALDPARTGDATLEVRASALFGLGVLALRQGDYDRAQVCLDDARSAWLLVGDQKQAATTLIMMVGVAELRGDEGAAVAQYEDALAFCRAIGDDLGIARTLENLGDAAYRRGDFAQAAALAREAVARTREFGGPVRLGMALVTMSQAAAACGDVPSATAGLTEALALSRDLGYEVGIAEAFCGFAELAARSAPVRAARLLGAVDSLLQRLGVPQLPHYALHRRAVASARAALDEPTFVVAWTAGQALTTEEAIAEAVAAVADVGDARRTREAPTTALGLTPREHEVLRLLAGGLSDRAIADALFIGERTVNTHVARIFEKLGVRNRAAAGAAAVTAGLIDPASAKTDPS